VDNPDSSPDTRATLDAVQADMRSGTGGFGSVNKMVRRIFLILASQTNEVAQIIPADRAAIIQFLVALVGKSIVYD
jgi:hypothetical protein